MLLIDVIIAFIILCLMLLLLLVLLWWCYSSCYSLFNGVSSSCSLLNVVASIVAFYLTLLLFNLFILNTTCSSICLLHHDVDVPCSLFLVKHCCSFSSYFRLIIPPLCFLQVWEELSKFKFFEPNLEGEIFFKKSLFVDEVSCFFHPIESFITITVEPLGRAFSLFFLVTTAFY